MNDATSRIATRYYENLEGGTGTFDPEALRAILHPDLVFEGPVAGSIVGTVRFAEFFTVAGERICSLRLLYDAGDYVAKGGR